MKFAIYTLGCKVNQYESQALEKDLIARGYTPGLLYRQYLHGHCGQ